jgi:hypothetical protein
VTKALMRSFPHVRAFHSYDGKFGIHFLASMEPLPSFSGAELASRMPPGAVSDFVEFGPETSAQKEFDLVLKREIPLQSLIQPYPNVPALSDDQPINEYFVMRKWFHAPR